MNDIIGYEDMREKVVKPSPVKDEVKTGMEDPKLDHDLIDEIAKELGEVAVDPVERSKMSFGSCSHALAVLTGVSDTYDSDDALEYLRENVSKISPHERTILGSLALAQIVGI